MADALGAPGSADRVEQVSGYVDLQFLRHGRLSALYRAVQEQRQRVVAVKVILLGALDNVELRRFRRECKLARRLSGHPHVAAPLDVGTTRSGSPYVAMDYFEHGSLADRVERDGPLPVEEVLRAGIEIAGALAAAHAVGILHRDVRPQNILVRAGGEHALGDFGIAALTDDRSQWRSPHHAAPEVLQGGPPTVASDVYSLGATLHHLLTGQPAYQEAAGDGIAPLLLRIASQGPPRMARRDLPPALEAVIRQAMAGDPQARMPDAFALADRLRQLQDDLAQPPVDLPPAGQVSQAPAASEPAPAISTHVDSPVAEPAPKGRALAPASASPPAAEREAAPIARTLVVVVAVALAIVALAAGLGLHQTPTGSAAHGPAGPRSPVATASPTSSPKANGTATPATDEGAIAAARPTGLTVADGGTAVVLHWHLATGNLYPLFVKVSPATRGQPGPRPVPNGSTTTTLTGLDSDAGYCFWVGAVVTLGQPSTVAWSAPTCIRGASPQPTAPLSGG
jgi:serine/threonine-protein kinase PknK